MSNSKTLLKKRVKARTPLVFLLIIALLVTAGWVKVGAASFEAVPSISARYTVKNNIDAVDTNNVNAVDATYLNYLLGVDLNYRTSRHGLSLSANASYQQYLTVDGDVEDAADTEPADYNFFNYSGALEYRYFYGQKFNFIINDTFSQNRDLQEVFGVGTNSLSYRYLHTNNRFRVAGIFRPNPKLSLRVGYNYHSLVFPDPENELIEGSKPPDSFENRGVVRTEYSFNRKLTGIIDVQYADRNFENSDYNTADYRLLQGVVGLRYKINRYATIEGTAGAAQRDVYDLSEATLVSPPYAAGTLAYDLEDTTDPIVNVVFNYEKPKRFSWNIRGQQGISTYGNNLFYTHTTADTTFQYFFDPKLSMELEGRYQRAVFNVDANGRDWQWDEDRTDDLMIASVRFIWDILQKDNRGTLTLIAGYDYNMRDSSIDDAEDYTATYRNNYYTRSYDTQHDLYYVQIKVAPIIIAGK